MSVKRYCTNCFKALSVSSRMQIYSFLEGKKEANVSEIVENLNLTQPTISYHLKEMEETGVLSSLKKGKEVYYKISHVCPFDDKKCVLG